MKLGLIGAGYWGKNLVRDFYKLGVLKIVCDMDINLLQYHKEKYPNINTTTNWNDILEDNDISAVCVSLPAQMHHLFAKQALEKGKDVYVEKPITLDIKEALELTELAKEKGLILMVGHLLHYHPAIEKIKEIVNNGRIGKIKSIVCNRLNLGKFRINENVLWSFAPHDISVVLSLCGNSLPDSIQTTGKDILTKGIYDVTNTVMIYETEGIYVNINTSWLNPYKEQRMSIVGEKGMILFDDVLKEGKLRLFKNYVNWSSSTNPEPIPGKSDGIIIDFDTSLFPLEKECYHFIQSCETRERPITDGMEGVRVLKVLTKAQESLNNNGNKYNFKEFDYFVHESSIVDSGARIGNGCKIWHYSHISSGCDIGSNCNIGQNVYVAKGSKLGSNCKIQNNVSIYSGVICEDNVFLGPSCVLTNDLNPRCEYSKNGAYINTYIERCSSIGANSTIICGNRIGHHSLIGAGAVVTKDVEPYSVMVGNPAKKIGTIDEYGNIT